ncbi:MAG: hypothetical protein HZB41_06245 [Ignavibacteriae bacterium]|nr:hypothetical protein [Ignavibacteriota bacterium]
MNVLISGKISDDNIIEIQKGFNIDEIKFAKISTKGMYFTEVSEFIQLLFKDFTAINFVRDFILSYIASKIISKVISSFKNKKIQNVRFELAFKKKNGKIKVVNFSISFVNYERMFEEADKIINSEMIENFADDKIIWISFKDDKIYFHQ